MLAARRRRQDTHHCVRNWSNLLNISSHPTVLDLNFSFGYKQARNRPGSASHRPEAAPLRCDCAHRRVGALARTLSHCASRCHSFLASLSNILHLRATNRVARTRKTCIAQEYII
ncbi:KLTH0B01518p [Lachancea thermotolerans CBS 6340]|uniref:KLTH0B01518p n=1 Tax=Lachancea thermotolerans (strain ATCC 56472 / CBS 6340 / NRRL Y-8284) TaxID=559295 RepID=C5DCA7_LACTC|nr:KLTH0B01518p [Lachancea thermotolerans CBS 6340]CAR21418.1 KLTH0B01518p [Lachancea thermotolerans CBS 6340]